MAEFAGVVPEPFAGRLAEFGVTTWRDLRDADPSAVAFWVGTDPLTVRGWQRLAQLEETVHAEPAFVNALVACGVGSLEALAHADAQALWQHLKEALAPSRRTGAVKSLDPDTVVGWVQGAAAALQSKAGSSNPEG